MAARFEFQLATGASVVGPVRGAGGFISTEARLLAAERNARSGRPTGLYEPRPGCVAVYPRYSAAGDGEPEIVSLTETEWRLVPQEVQS